MAAVFRESNPKRTSVTFWVHVASDTTQINKVLRDFLIVVKK